MKFAQNVPSYKNQQRPRLDKSSTLLVIEPSANIEPAALDRGAVSDYQAQLIEGAARTTVEDLGEER